MQQITKLESVFRKRAESVLTLSARMMTFKGLVVTFLCVSSGVAGPSRAVADDWPAWRGPNRDGISRETGLLKEWPPEGPKLLWKATGLGEGNSTPSIVGKLLYVMGDRDGKEWVMALDWTGEGKQAWATPVGPIRHKGNGFPGPRSTPTIDAGRLYTLGINGDLLCLDAGTGRVIWRHDLVGEFGGKVPAWGYSESVLIDGEWVVCTPGGQRATVLALRKADGRSVWASPVGDPAAYSSIIEVSIGQGKQVRQYVQLTEKGLIGVNASDGKLLWRYGRRGNGHAKVTTTVWFGQTVFTATGYGSGSGALVRIEQTAEGFSPQELYSTKGMKSHLGGMILLDGYLYGCNDPSILTCLKYETGQVMWTDRSSGRCSLLYADSVLYCRSEKGPVSLVEATAEGFRLKGRFNQPDRSNKQSWPHPVIANGRLFLRDQDVLLCYDVQAEGK